MNCCPMLQKNFIAVGDLARADEVAIDVEVPRLHGAGAAVMPVHGEDAAAVVVAFEVQPGKLLGDNRAVGPGNLIADEGLQATQQVHHRARDLRASAVVAEVVDKRGDRPAVGAAPEMTVALECRAR